MRSGRTEVDWFPLLHVIFDQRMANHLPNKKQHTHTQRIQSKLLKATWRMGGEELQRNARARIGESWGSCHVQKAFVILHMHSGCGVEVCLSKIASPILRDCMVAGT